MSDVRLSRAAGPLKASIHLPRSKSAANRALIIAALLGDLDLVQDPGTGDDTAILLHHLREQGPVMHCGAGATTFRFLLAWACCQPGGPRTITGDARLLERPHEDLVQALRHLGARIDRVPEGYRVHGGTLRGGEVHFDSPISSQYLSALLLIAPSMTDGLHLRWTGTRLSEPYVHMTLKIMAHFGVFPAMELDGVRVEPSSYHPAPYTVPADWSGAAFWYEVVALTPGSALYLQGLSDDTLQGDRAARHLWAPWVDTRFDAEGAVISHRSTPGALPEGPVNLRNHPDLFQPLLATCAGLGVPATFTGLDNLRVKETDRLRAMADALHTLGAQLHLDGGTATLTGQVQPNIVRIDPEGDHRMALSIAPLVQVTGELHIARPEVVTKSYPGFWEELQRVGLQVDRSL
jgi:3-phosphoshikimate 1-carboxyvinyltransferase